MGEASKTVPYGNYDTDVLETRDYTPIEPADFELKYYAPGIGLILEDAFAVGDDEDDPDDPTGERVELVALPAP
ncbi:MAG: hypothetical protein PVF20_10200 [Desulfobacterales bacterium]|jgi:hypothetical protein